MTSATSTKRKMTAEEFWQLCADGKPRELVRGDALTCDDLLPGFSLPLKTLFGGL